MKSEFADVSVNVVIAGYDDHIRSQEAKHFNKIIEKLLDQSILLRLPTVS
jgi:hypothetical protein